MYLNEKQNNTFLVGKLEELLSSPSPAPQQQPCPQLTHSVSYHKDYTA